MPEQTTSVGMDRKLAAIFSTDVVGYSRLMGDDEEATIHTLTAYRVVISSLIQHYRGRVVDSPGDNLLAEFASVVDAVRCAVEIQHALTEKNAELPDHRQMRFRIGINLGDVIVEGERLYGDGVNIAARLESLALPGGICISGTVYDQVKNKLPLAYEDLGAQAVKNIYALIQQYDQAIAAGEQALALAPNNADRYAGQAHVLIWVGRAEEAIDMAKQAVRRNPRYPPGHVFQLGWACRLTGRYAEAIPALKEFIRRSPNIVPGHLNLAFGYAYQWAYQQNADARTLEQALAEAQRVIAINESDPLGHALLGLISLWHKQYEQAIAEGERAVALNSNLADGYAFLAEALSRVGKSEDALRMAEQALRHNSWVRDEHLRSIGIAYDLAKRPEEAIAPLKQFLSHYPNILGAHLTLAAVYSELGKDAEARAEVTEVLRLNPKFSLEVHKERVPIKDPATLERHVAALRKAGLK